MRDLYAHYALSVTFGDSSPKGGAKTVEGAFLASPFGRGGCDQREQTERAQSACTQKSICSEHCRCFSFCLFAYFFKYSSHPEEVTTCWSVVHQRASTPSRLSTIFWPSSSGIQNRPVVRQSARPESLHSTVTLLK